MIVRAGAAPPTPPADATGGYAVYLGQRVSAEVRLDRARLVLRNAANGRRWLITDVTPRG